MFRWFLILVLLLAAVVGLLLGSLNVEPVELDLLLVNTTLPLGALVMAALVAGVLLGLLLSWLLFILPGQLGRKSDKRRRKKGSGLPDPLDG